MVIAEYLVDYIKVLTHHFILRECSCLVCQHVLDSTELLRDGASANHSPGDGLVPLDHPGVHHLTHVQIDT